MVLRHVLCCVRMDCLNWWKPFWSSPRFLATTSFPLHHCLWKCLCYKQYVISFNNILVFVLHLLWKYLPQWLRHFCNATAICFTFCKFQWSGSSRQVFNVTPLDFQSRDLESWVMASWTSGYHDKSSQQAFVPAVALEAFQDLQLCWPNQTLFQQRQSRDLWYHICVWQMPWQIGRPWVVNQSFVPSLPSWEPLSKNGFCAQLRWYDVQSSLTDAGYSCFVLEHWKSPSFFAESSCCSS